MRALYITAASAALGLASISSAAMVVQNYYRMGEEEAALPDVGTAIGGGNPTHSLVGTKFGYGAIFGTGPNPVYADVVPTNSGITGGSSTRSVYMSGTTVAPAASGYLNAGTDVAPLDNWGIEAWINPTALTSGNQTIFNMGGTNGRIMLRINNLGAGGLPRLETRFSSSVGANGNDMKWDVPTSVAATMAGAWNHVALVRDSGHTALYVNGVTLGLPSSGSQGDAAVPYWAEGTSTSLFLGQGASGTGVNNPFTGNIDEVRFFTFDDADTFDPSFLLVSSVPEPSMMGIVAVSAVGLIRRRRHS